MEDCCENCKYFHIEGIYMPEGRPKGYCHFLHCNYEDNNPREMCCTYFIRKGSDDTVPGHPIGGPAGPLLEERFVKGIEKCKTPEEILNWYRNLYYREYYNTEHRIMADAINEIFSKRCKNGNNID